MPDTPYRAMRRTKIVSTLGPATSDHATIRALAVAGVDVFRLNFSHGTHGDHAARHGVIRDVEAELGRPLGILADVQGPKLRVGTFANGRVQLTPGARFRLDLDPAPGNETRVCLPHREILAAAEEGSTLLLDDGRLALKVCERGPDFLLTEVTLGGVLSDHKGVNVPDVVLPIPALTDKDRADMAFALDLGIEYVGLSFVQRPEDVREARRLADGRAWIMTKLEKPQAMDNLEEIVALSDAVMVARGDLGVELPPELVPLAQKRIIRVARRLGRPVVVATQMLESMVHAPTPTRAEASDVATAVFDGADAVMLSAETAVGAYPREAVAIMDRIVRRVEEDEVWRCQLEASSPEADHNVAGAIAAAARQIVATVDVAAVAAFTLSGRTALRIARERPACTIIGLAPSDDVARRLAVAWGVQAVSVGQETPVHTIESVVDQALSIIKADGYGGVGDAVVIVAGLPFGVAGSTNTLRIATIT
ncbi:pyruvate kinase [Komagataeibacter rhaeticus]|uniref:pyruvate kinase n=1 Tax=Komagataeibacter rhaeticus TaxID=215221 RepID=UPI0004D4EA2F|nr:pyruvate kinase [Komagataeibacter rhaeticus]KDU97614.1 pyruvate kinase [Komagataeibacter rhaeticus AF1]MBL7241377.1 pyruvate kinase [Komagataeibacter rhaeticus]PYD54861.1 pyruvate kinase [Komagataeibacter rhaeticus]GBQ12611.1 pyruvate kinase [Komagataeibacter rhaeticus DSM 16663]